LIGVTWNPTCIAHALVHNHIILNHWVNITTNIELP